METKTSLSNKLEEIDDLELSSSLQEKKGRYYVVISYTSEKGKSKAIWRATGIKATSANKKLAKDKAKQIMKEFKNELKEEIKKEAEQDVSPFAPEQLQIEYENLDSNILEQDLSNDLDKQRLDKYNNMSFTAFVKESIDEFKHNVTNSTYICWESIYTGRILDYFRVIPLSERASMKNPNVERPIYYDHVPKLIEITQFDIEDFIKWLYDCNLKSSSADKYYVLFKLVFARAYRKKIIKKENNPMNDVPKPKIDPYIPEYYKPSELKLLFDIVKDDIIEVPILFAATYGLRRSEVLGIKWDAIDFEAGTFVIKHTVTKVVGMKEKQEITCRDLTKSKYGYRTYPLTSEIIKALKKQKENIEVREKYIYKNKYVQQTKEYVCVKENGELIKPDHLSKRFKELIKIHELKQIRFHDIRHSVRKFISI